MFLCLFRTWCHNPVAAVALCLLTQNYFLVCKLLQTLYPFSVKLNYTLILFYQHHMASNIIIIVLSFINFILFKIFLSHYYVSASMDVTIDLLIEVDKLIQLLESPIFICMFLYNGKDLLYLLTFLNIFRFENGAFGRTSKSVFN